MPTQPKPEPRKVRALNRQTMIAIPPWARRRLGAAPGVTLYWYGHRKGEVILATTARRPSGYGGRSDLEDEVRQLAAERDELRQALTGNQLAGARATYAQSYMQAMRYLGPLTARMEALMQKVDRVIEQRHGQPGDRARFRRARAQGARRRVEVVALPEASTLVGGVGGESSAGAAPEPTAPA
jgi:hypothetical protein